VVVERCPALWQDTWPTLTLLDIEGMSMLCDTCGLGTHGVSLGRLSGMIYDRLLPCISDPSLTLKRLYTGTTLNYRTPLIAYTEDLR
jgi:hypothetical protein